MHLSDVEVVPWSSPSDMHTTRNEADLVDTANAFEELRPRLFGIAYQTLGRRADAEDVVQDAWIRWQCADRAQVRDGVAFLVTITTRVALNAATSARARREIDVAEPFPARDDTFVDPAAEAERSEALTTAVQLLIARLSPPERAVSCSARPFSIRFARLPKYSRSAKPTRGNCRTERVGISPNNGRIRWSRRCGTVSSPPSSMQNEPVTWHPSSTCSPLRSSPDRPRRGRQVGRTDRWWPEITGSRSSGSRPLSHCEPSTDRQGALP